MENKIEKRLKKLEATHKLQKRVVITIICTLIGYVVILKNPEAVNALAELLVFESGTTISSSEMNENFGALKTSIDESIEQINTNTEDISTNAESINSNTTSIAANKSLLALMDYSTGTALNEDIGINPGYDVTSGFVAVIFYIKNNHSTNAAKIFIDSSRTMEVPMSGNINMQNNPLMLSGPVTLKATSDDAGTAYFGGSPNEVIIRGILISESSLDSSISLVNTSVDSTTGFSIANEKTLYITTCTIPVMGATAIELETNSIATFPLQNGAFQGPCEVFKPPLIISGGTTITSSEQSIKITGYLK